jgi:ferritin-like metal-binding protein YciE
MSMTSLTELFLHDLGAMYSAEKLITLALPQMAGAASSPELAEAFRNHLMETRGQMERIEQAVATMGLPLQTPPCPAMLGLIQEGNEMMMEIPRGPLLDVALISAAQKVEHHEISAYTSLITLAEQLGLQDAATLLQATLAEETATDAKLSALAEQDILAQASKTAQAA